MYDPSIGRFTSVDPSGFAAGDADLYRFVGNNPVNETDPSGLKIASANPVDTDNPDPYRHWIYIPDDQWNNRQDYITHNVGLFRESPLTPEEQGLADQFAGNKDAEMEIAKVMTEVNKTWVFPAIGGLGIIWPDTFGSHCVRWTNDLMGRLIAEPAIGKYVYFTQQTLRYPGWGGPEHSIILIRRKGAKKVFGIDNGTMGTQYHLFDPRVVIKKREWPVETTIDLLDAVSGLER